MEFSVVEDGCSIANSHPLQKYPALLSSDSYVTALIIRQCHERIFHNKTRETLDEFRSGYWITKARQTIRRIIYRCVWCHSFEGQPFPTPVMAHLPEFKFDSEVPAFQTKKTLAELESSQYHRKDPKLVPNVNRF